MCHKFGIVIFLVLIVSTSAAESIFSDVAGHWCETPINSFYEQGLINGYGNGKFLPDDNITKAEYADIVNKFFKYAGTFSGMAWEEENLRIAKDLGYFSLNSSPKETLTREEALVSMNKFINLECINSNPTFSDADNISGWAEGIVCSMKLSGIVNGYPDNNIKPKEEISRAEVIQILYNLSKTGIVEENNGRENYIKVCYMEHTDEGALKAKEIEGTLEIKAGEVIVLAIVLPEGVKEDSIKIYIKSGKDKFEFNPFTYQLSALGEGEAEIAIDINGEERVIKVCAKK